MIKAANRTLATLAARLDLPTISPWIWILTGALLRLAGLTSSSIWYDEAFSLELVKFDPITLVKLAQSDFTPPLWELLIWLPIRLAGANELTLRLLAFLGSVLTLWLLYRIAQQLELTPGQTHSALALAALLPGMIWTAQDGRVYAILSALYLGAVWFALKQRWLGLFACSALMCYAHNIGPFLVPSVVALYGYRGAGWRKANLVFILTAFIALPWLPGYLNASVTPHWLGPLTLDSWLVSLGQAFTISLPSMGAWALVGLFVTTCLIFSLTLSLPPASDKTERSLLLIAAAPLVVMLGWSITRQNMIFYRPLIPLVIPFCLLLARTLTPRRLTVTSWILPWFWICLLFTGLFTWSPELKGGDLARQAELIRAKSLPGDIVYHATGTTALPFRYYLPELVHVILDEEQPAALLQSHLSRWFGFQRYDLDEVEHTRAWIIVPLDPVMTITAARRINAMLDGAELLGEVIYLQAAPIQIYLKE